MQMEGQIVVKAAAPFNNCIEAYHWLAPEIEKIAGADVDIGIAAQRAAELLLKVLPGIAFVGVYSLHNGKLEMRVAAGDITDDEEHRLAYIAEQVRKTREARLFRGENTDYNSQVAVPVMDSGVLFGVSVMTAAKGERLNDGAVIGLTNLSKYFAKRLIND